MVSAGLFTKKDLTTIYKAASLAEKLTQNYFDSADEWERNPYFLFTLEQVGSRLYETDAFANVVRLNSKKSGESQGRFGIILQDPNILRSLLRSQCHDLWTLSLFVLTHELIHIVRFRKYGVDFFASTDERGNEEEKVNAITREILAGAGNTDYIISLYENTLANSEVSIPRHTSGGSLNADLRVSL